MSIVGIAERTAEISMTLAYRTKTEENARIQPWRIACRKLFIAFDDEAAISARQCVPCSHLFSFASCLRQLVLHLTRTNPLLTAVTCNRTMNGLAIAASDSTRRQVQALVAIISCPFGCPCQAKTKKMREIILL